MKYFNKFCNLVNKIYTYLGVLLLVIICIACILQVFSRYVLGRAIPGTEEISRYSFIWLGFLGSAICVEKWSNAHISILNDGLKGKARMYHSGFLNLMVFLCAALLFVQGIKCTGVTSRQLSSMLRIPMNFVYAAIPFGAFGMMLSAAQRFLELFSQKDHKEVQH